MKHNEIMYLESLCPPDQWERFLRAFHNNPTVHGLLTHHTMEECILAFSIAIHEIQETQLQFLAKLDHAKQCFGLCPTIIPQSPPVQARENQRLPIGPPYQPHGYFEDGLGE